MKCFAAIFAFAAFGAVSAQVSTLDSYCFDFHLTQDRPPLLLLPVEQPAQLDQRPMSPSLEAIHQRRRAHHVHL